MDDLSHYNPEGSTLRRMQLRMLEMLIEVDRVFRKRNIEYWIEYGTLIGAVRHGGFIPWDDDIDIGIRHQDIHRAHKALAEELSDRFALQDTATDKNAFFPYLRVRDRHSYCYHPDFVCLKEQGIWLDIFCYDPVPSARAKKAADAIYRRAYHEIHNLSLVTTKSPVRRLFNRVMGYLIYPIGVLAKQIVIAQGRKSSAPMFGVFGTRTIIFPAQPIFPLTEVEFEGHTFPAPGNWDRHLRDVYGDYMQLPRPESRVPILDLSKVTVNE